MDAYDKERARHHAQKSAENMYDEHYVRRQGAEEYDPQAYGRPAQFESGGYGGGNDGGYGGNEGGYGGGRDY